MMQETAAIPITVQVQVEDFDSAALTETLRADTAGSAGALVSFTGYVRDFAPESPTRALFLEHYPGMCERTLSDIALEAAGRWRLLQAAIVHRIGELTQGEQIVFVAVGSAHRGDAFEACRYIMDALKTRAPFWKRELLADGSSFWVEARASDEAQAKSWEVSKP